jgi:hypothetical protein
MIPQPESGPPGGPFAAAPVFMQEPCYVLKASEKQRLATALRDLLGNRDSRCKKLRQQRCLSLKELLLISKA